MGNANTHERRKSGVPETGLTIENIREKPLVDEAVQEVLRAGAGAEEEEKRREAGREEVEGPTPTPGSPSPPAEFRPRAGTDSSSEQSAVSGTGPSAPPSGPPTRCLPTIFKFSGRTAKEAFVCGTFSNWEKIPMVKSQKDFVALVDLPVGEHQFKYFVDNEWTHDKQVPTAVSECGTTNNVITIQQDDFEAFSALDMDSRATNVSNKRGPEAEFGQEIPGLSSFESKPGPPILPPHLLQVILNKDTPLSCEPTLLPEPNHVMINHLYALSIKDGVMVISSTQRFRRKYVTTLLYKPIEA